HPSPPHPSAPPLLCPPSLHDALPISDPRRRRGGVRPADPRDPRAHLAVPAPTPGATLPTPERADADPGEDHARGSRQGHAAGRRDRKSTRLNSSHVATSYAVFCLKKK